jgi:hypothetical protein
MTSKPKKVLRWSALSAALAGSAGVAALRRRAQRTRSDGDAYAVVVNVPVEKLRPQGAHWTPPLAEIAEHARLSVEPTPEGRGSQVLAISHDPPFDVRAELRAAKQLLETGEVLLAPPEPSGRGQARQRITARFDRLLGAGGQR